VDAVRFGLSVRALRRRRRWTQSDLGRRVGLSKSTVSRIERGEAGRFAVQVIDRVIEALGARLQLRVLWQGEALDRLLDADHAQLVEAVIQLLAPNGWITVPEATFAIGGERGSIDVLAFHPASGTLLVVEVKSVIADVQGTLSGLDRKARVARRIASDRAWRVAAVGRVLVLPEDRTARRRVARSEGTFDAALPARNIAVRHWIQNPVGPIAGILFLSDVNQQQPRHRVPAAGRRATLGPRIRS
jgi:transcriptional regulator with XRE-family HTH domain